MSSTSLRNRAKVAASLVALAASGAPGLAASFSVNVTTDTAAVSPSTSPKDSAGNISLRSAIMAANAQPGADVINLQSATIYKLSIVPALGEIDLHNSATGDLDITDALTINGAGATVDGRGIDRVFAIENMDDTDFVVTINNVTITGGAPKGLQRPGGGISVRAATLNLTGCAVRGNATSPPAYPSNGGGIAANGVGVPTAVPATLNLTDCTISGNTANNGGGILAGNCILNLNGCVVSNNAAVGLDSGSGGGGIFLTGSSTVATITGGSLIASNTGKADGGGISVFSATLIMQSGTISQNTSALNGGGIYNSVISAGSITLSGLTVSENASLGDGGGVYSTGACSLTNSTVSGNIAHAGGGIAGNATLNYVTVAANNAVSSGGGLYPLYPAYAISAYNSIVADNTAPTGPDAVGSVLSMGYNLFGSTAGMSLYNNMAGNILNVNAKLGPLSYNGGNTFTHAPLPGSPAIDAAYGVSYPPTDQRGVRRPDGGSTVGAMKPDMGAVEIAPKYATLEVGRALRIAGGLLAATSNDMARLNVDATDARITVRDAARIARKAAGLDPNP